MTNGSDSNDFDVYFQDPEFSDVFDLVPVGNFATQPLTHVSGGYSDAQRATRKIELDYINGFDTTKYQVVGNVDEVIEKPDGSGIYFYLDSKNSSDHNGTIYSVSQTVYLKVVTR